MRVSELDIKLFFDVYRYDLCTRSLLLTLACADKFIYMNGPNIGERIRENAYLQYSE